MAEGDGEGQANGAHSGTLGVFISYASQDAAVANSIVENLERHGLRCWVAPRDVKPGARYADAIVRAINEASALVLVLSANAIGSDHVAREIERAASKHKQVIAFRIDAMPLSPELEYFLSNSQWIDVPALGTPAALKKLAEAVGQGPTQAKVAASPGAAVKPVAKTGRLAIAAVILVGIGAAVALAVHFWPFHHGGTQVPVLAAISDKSIAVLPFTDMSEKHDQEYFGDGMAEEILDLLVKIPGLKVIGRTSSFQFKGKNEDLRKIGTALGAAYVLEGSVRKSSEQVRITAQLINTKTGAHEWSETYDRHIDDVLKLQDAIAAAVARELQLAVAPGDANSRSNVRDPEAYELMLRGRHAADRGDQDGLAEAVTLFQQALVRDPMSADAAASFAFAYQQQVQTGSPAAVIEQARRAAVTALGLDPKNARAHFVLGLIHLTYDWDWAAAEREFQQAATLAPGSANAPNGASHLFITLGRWNDALEQVKAAIVLEPLDPDNFLILSWIQARRSHLPEAEVAARRLLDIRPKWAWGHNNLGLVLLARGEPDAALLRCSRRH